jgi:hypothetical protein
VAKHVQTLGVSAQVLRLGLFGPDHTPRPPSPIVTWEGSRQGRVKPICAHDETEPDKAQTIPIIEPLLPAFIIRAHHIRQLLRVVLG